jgi:hypothetical protein
MNPLDPMPADPQAVAAVTATVDALGGVNPDDAELIREWRNRLDQSYAHDTDARDRYEIDRKYARGDSKWLVDTNLVGAILEVLESHVYAKDPDFVVQVTESVDNERAKAYQGVTDTLRIVVSRLLKDAGLKRKGKRQVRTGHTCGAGWLRVSLTTHGEKDPIVQNEINTLQENLRELEALERNLAEGEVCSEGAARAEIAARLTALQSKLERQVADGIALDWFSPDDVQVSSECGELVGYVDSPWIRFRTYKGKLEAQRLTGWSAEQLKGANVYAQRKRTGNETPSSGKQNDWIKVTDPSAQTADGFIAFEEIWDRTTGMVYTLVDGINDRWARAPFAPVTGSRFYDCFLYAPHFVDGERHPQSDVHQLRKLQDEYGRTRSNFAETRKRSIPMTVWDAADMPATELSKVNSAEANEHVAVAFTGNPETPVQSRMARITTPPIDPALYSTQPITTDMEKMSGAQDAMQSSVAVEKTATEAQIQNSGFGARIGNRRDALEDMLAEMGLFVAQLALQALPETTVQKLAGSRYVWPKLSVDEVMSAFDFEVKAGSTGKPDKAAKRAAWMSLLPLIEKLITVVGNFRSKGPAFEWAVKPYVAMLEMTFDLLDMRHDVERFLPQPPPVDPMVAALAGAMGGAPGAPAEGGMGGDPMTPVLDNIGTPDSTPAAPASAS